MNICINTYYVIVAFEDLSCIVIHTSFYTVFVLHFNNKE